MESPEQVFAAFVAEVRGPLDAALGDWLAVRMEQARRLTPEAVPVADGVTSLTMRGGKRLRAALVAAAFVASGGERWQSVMGAMMAIELLQTYLLIHDDWMDGDDMRRGGPSVHHAMRTRYEDAHVGDSLGILAGDLGSGYAQEALLEVEVSAERRLQACHEFARMQQEVVLGQVLDVLGSEDTDAVNNLKTASYTVRGPLRLGAVLAGVSRDRLGAWDALGTPLGIAFQLRDDLMGAFGDARATGKPIFSDWARGKRNALVTELAKDAEARALLGKRDSLTPEQTAKLVSLAETSGAKSRVEGQIAAHLEAARGAIARLEVHPRGEALLTGATLALGVRDR